MITVRLPPGVEPYRLGGWHLVFYFGTGELPDYTVPFRAILSEMAGALGGHGGAVLELPDREDWEDFVEGRLLFGPHALGVYFEHSLAYLSLSCPDRAPLDEAWSVLSGMVAVG